MLLFHATTPEAARLILRDGFVGSSGSYGFAATEFDDVVWMSTDPAGVGDGAKGETVLVVDLGARDVEPYGITDDRGRGTSVTWEYAVPAEVLNQLPPGSVYLAPI